MMNRSPNERPTTNIVIPAKAGIHKDNESDSRLRGNDDPLKSPPSKSRPRWQRWAIEAGIILLIIMVIRSWQHQDMASGPAPLLAGSSVAQTPIQLSEFKGQAVLIHFFAPWCPVCTAMHGNIDTISQHYPVILVASSTEPEDLSKWLSKHPEDNLQRMLLDRDGVWLNAFGSKALPTDVFIDKEGNISSTELGYTSTLGLWIRLWLLE
jgi:thiol-disulfide isomerase/thioredoxin